MWQLAWSKTMSDYENFCLEVDTIQKSTITHNVDGSLFRCTLSNEYGKVPLHIKSVQVESLGIKKEVLFDYNQSVVIDIKKDLVSDVVEIEMRRGCPIHIWVELSFPQSVQTLGNCYSDKLICTNQNMHYYFGLRSIEINTLPHYHICFFGDSLTEQGYFTDAIALDSYTYPQISTYNCGISGNRLLYDANSESDWESTFNVSGIKRFEKDVYKNGVPDMVLFMEGINDLFHPGNGSPIEELPTASKLIEGIKHIQKICVKNKTILVVCTLTPFKGSVYHNKEAWDNHRELIRKEVNEYIKTLPYFVDLDVIEDGQGSLKLFYDSGDHLHFNKQGGQKIGQYIFKKLLNIMEENGYEL